MRLETFWICPLLVTMASAASGIDHFPLTEGILYEYEYSIYQGGGTYTTHFSGTINVEGTTTHVLRFAGLNYGLLQFWSENPESDKLLHGFQQDMSSVLWLPPIVTIDEPLFVGKIWEVDSRSSDSIAVHIQYEVTASGAVTVPAGTFPAFTIRESLEFPEGGPSGKIDSHIRGIRGFTNKGLQITDYSFVDGIGRILETSASGTHRLRSFRTIAVQPSTWTRIRNLYL